MAGQSVLAIEQDWRLRKLLRANLEALGLEVWEAVNQQHGLESLENGRPDLILLDLDLPNGGAVKMLQALDRRFQGRPVPIVLLSAEPPPRSLLHGRGVAGWLLKPFDVSRLIAQIRNLLDPPIALGGD
jgi:two-component system chemotaxis response regulator CheY